MARKKIAAGPWSDTVGTIPHRVTVEERPKHGHAIYLRWWDASKGNWKRRSLMSSLAASGIGARSLRDHMGVIQPGVAAWAVDQAWAQFRRLAGLSSDQIHTIAAPLTISRAWQVVTDPDTGLYPADSDHRREVKAALAFASRIWGDDTPWSSIGRADLTKLARRRLTELLDAGHTGLRGTEITMQRVITVAGWLRDEGHIPVTACIAKLRWRDELKKDWIAITQNRRLPEPAQPRYTPEESRKIHAAAPKVDPRMALLLGLAAEYRLGQALRSYRSDLILESTPDAPDGTFEIHGSGKKMGEIVYLTPGQRRVVDDALTVGYLAELESEYQDGKIADYALFPKARLSGRKTGNMRLARDLKPTETLTRDWMIKVFAKVEDAAEISHIAGRGAYGMRRINVDGALDTGISDRGLKASGGWKSVAVPKDIYAERENRAGRKEAAKARAKTRGETNNSTEE